MHMNRSLFILGTLLLSIGAMAHANVSSTAATNDALFKSVWGSFWFKPIQNATYQSFKVATDPGAGFYGKYLNTDPSYEVLADNTMPLATILVPFSWSNRSVGTIWQGQVHLPQAFVVPNTIVGNTPNNPTIIYNTTSKTALCLNGMVRPVPGGPIWGYKSDTAPFTHGGSGLIGGEVTATELQEGAINHAIGIEVWAQKYLSAQNGGFFAPATKADSGYNLISSGNYYGGNIPNLKMGSHLAIPPSVTMTQIGITSPVGKELFTAFKTYGAYIVDNTGWDALYIESTPDATSEILAHQSEFQSLFAALEIVN